ncbi:Nse4 C-terminal-domain-containing protein [Tribonema minus]|uniref:Non-structural maintenance of chromosomes element 4 n=1 Tax=Tribonema minus TaxID=303371 RepID=A0A835YSI9_9STRA|nr:Nse4 C-terminal-domain-containing protein [Tribonema minus]
MLAQAVVISGSSIAGHAARDFSRQEIGLLGHQLGDKELTGTIPADSLTENIQLWRAANEAHKMRLKEQRRALRRTLAAHGEELVADRPQIAQLGSDAFDKAVDKSSEIFEEVKYPREAYLDIENLKKISDASTRQVGSLKAKGLPFGHEEFLASLAALAKPRNAEVDWAMIGHAVSPCIRCIPRMDLMLGPLDKPKYMLGPLDKPKVVRAVQRERKQKPKDNFERVVPITVKEGGKEAEQKDPQQIRQTAMKDRFLEPGRSAEFAKFIMNPNSFTQTVENMFDFTFYIKNGLTGLAVDKEAGKLNTQFTRILSQDDAASRSSNKQSVLSFTRQDFKNLIELCGLEGQEPMIPARPMGAGSDYYDPLVDLENNGGGGGGSHVAQ